MLLRSGQPCASASRRRNFSPKAASPIVPVHIEEIARLRPSAHGILPSGTLPKAVMAIISGPAGERWCRRRIRRCRAFLRLAQALGEARQPLPCQPRGKAKAKL